jgi:hypothetical protein
MNFKAKKYDIMDFFNEGCAFKIIFTEVFIEMKPERTYEKTGRGYIIVDHKAA